jgi:peroxiredoxin
MQQGQILLVTVTAVLGFAMAGLAVAIYQLIKQQGRLLMRLDQIERHLELDAGQAVERGTVAIQAGSPAGLPLGTALPDFRLSDLAGRPVSLAEFRGRRVLLVNWSARCGFCTQIAADLAGMEPDLERFGVQLLLVSRGPDEAEKELAEEHGLRCPILPLKGGEIEAFARLGTPAAYLLDEEGRVARPLAVGASQVPILARDAMPKGAGLRTRLPGERPLSESRIARDGLAPGTRAPAFELPEVRGGRASLEEHRGKKVLLVFSDPACGPCEQLAPHLTRLHDRHRNNGLDLLLVGRGSLEENRQKADEHGYEFPVAVQRRWDLSRQYGIFTTPVGFLIDENGVIAQGVARGTDEILALVPETPVAGKEVAHG